MLAVIASFVFMLLCIGAFAFSFAHDRSWYRNCYLMFMSFLSVIPFALNSMGSFGKPVIVVLADIVLIAMLLTPYFLIHNGIVMIKKRRAQHPAPSFAWSWYSHSAGRGSLIFCCDCRNDRQ